MPAHLKLKMKTSLKTFTALCALTLFALNPASTHAETLEEAVSVTLSQHPEVESARAAMLAAGQRKREQKSAFFPELQVNATGGRIYGDNSTSRGLSVTRGAGYSYLWEGSVSATQQIYDGWETTNRVKAAQAEKEAASMSIMDVQETLALRTAETYINLFRVRNGLDMLVEQKNSVADYMDRISSLVDDGAADEAELQQARDVSVILDNFIADYTGQLRILESSYNELTGHFPTEIHGLPNLAVDSIPPAAEDAVATAKTMHPSLKSARLASKSAKYDVRAEESTYIPKFDGELSYLKSDKDDVIGGEVEDGRAVVRMNWAFETGGGQSARIKQRVYAHKQAMATVAETERRIERDIRDAYAELETAKRQLGNQKKRQDLNKKLFDTYKVQFEGARISLLQLMQSDNQLLLTKLETMNAQSRLQLAQYSILSSMGLLQKTLNVEEVMAEAQSYPRHEPD